MQQSILSFPFDYYREEVLGMSLFLVLILNPLNSSSAFNRVGTHLVQTVRPIFLDSIVNLVGLKSKNPVLLFSRKLNKRKEKMRRKVFMQSKVLSLEYDECKASVY